MTTALVPSLAEWEWAWRYALYLTIGEPRPDTDGFDKTRLKEIREAVEAEYYRRRDAAFVHVGKRIRRRGS